MKTISELDAMQVPVLKAIAKDLQLSFANNIKKADLVNLVFHAQQPTTEDLKNDEENKKQAAKQAEKREENAVTAGEQVDAMLNKIGNFFGGNLVETEEEGDEGVVFSIVDPVEGEEIVRGTYSELAEKMAELEKIRAKEAFESKKAMKAAQEPLDPNDLSVQEPERGNAPPPAPVEHVKTVEAELDALRKLGLKAHVKGDSVELTFRGRTIETTIHQPVQRIIRIAEQHISRA